MFAELLPTKTDPKEETQAEIRIPTLPDVRPFGCELAGQEITFDAHASRVLTPFSIESDFLYNIESIENYLNIFKDYPYIFNLGHGVLPETKPETIKYIIQIVRDKE